MKVTTLIPLRRNDKTKVSKAEKYDILNRIWDTFGGYTIEGKTKGAWEDGDEKFEDKCLKVVIDCDNSRLGEVEELIVSIGKQLGQRAMWVEVQYFDGVRIIRCD